MPFFRTKITKIEQIVIAAYKYEPVRYASFTSTQNTYYQVYIEPLG